MKLYRVPEGWILEKPEGCYISPTSRLDDLLSSGRTVEWVEELMASSTSLVHPPSQESLLAPIESQEIWAAGVTYFRSRDARMEEAEKAGGGSFYDRVYSADRPELFFKGNARRAVGPGGEVRIRADSTWNVPEPELTLVLSAEGKVLGYTLGNDMSSRDIEGENPLYLPQAKVYQGSAALGPCILLREDPLPPDTAIEIVLERDGKEVFRGSTALSAMKRRPGELADYLFREDEFPHGCLLMTGTGIVPPAEFTLKSGDRIAIVCEPIGTLINWVA
jgi:2-dehydro-3-deoxy-D-arabinonate dehydratase